MAQLSIVSFGESAGIVIPPEMLESAGLRVGDVVDVTLSDRKLILRPSQDVARRQQLEAIIQDVFERRQDAYQRLA
jgi:antitoxin component of MazEF toxin-antitoxin module